MLIDAIFVPKNLIEMGVTAEEKKKNIVLPDDDNSIIQKTLSQL